MILKLSFFTHHFLMDIDLMHCKNSWFTLCRLLLSLSVRLDFSYLLNSRELVIFIIYNKQKRRVRTASATQKFQNPIIAAIKVERRRIARIAQLRRKLIQRDTIKSEVSCVRKSPSGAAGLALDQCLISIMTLTMTRNENHSQIKQLMS